MGGTRLLRIDSRVKMGRRNKTWGDKISEDESCCEGQEQDSRGGKNKISEDDSRGEGGRKKTAVVGGTRKMKKTVVVKGEGRRQPWWEEQDIWV